MRMLRRDHVGKVSSGSQPHHTFNQSCTVTDPFIYHNMRGAPGQLETYQLPNYGFVLRTEVVFLLERQHNARMKATKTRSIQQTIK